MCASPLAKNFADPVLSIHQDLKNLPGNRLKSRKPPWQGAKLEPQDITHKWKERWKWVKVTNYQIVHDPNIKPAGFLLSRNSWVKLNRLRTGHGRTKEALHNWGFSDNSLCECRELQTSSHIIETCPIYVVQRFTPGYTQSDRYISDVDRAPTDPTKFQR